jgi:hypothetical protein
MKITSPGKTFKHKEDLPLLYQDFSALELTHYEVTSYGTFDDVTLIDRFTVGCLNAANYAVGDEIVVDTDGFISSNRIAQIGNQKLRLTKEVDFSASDVSIKKDFYLYTIKSTCPQGYYLFSTLELVIIKNVFQQAMITFSSIKARARHLVDSFEEADYPGYNQEALDSVYADLNYITKVWNVIDASQFKELLVKKILALAETSGTTESRIFNDEYTEYLGRVVMKLEVKGNLYAESEESAETVEIEPQLNKSSFTFELGA